MNKILLVLMLIVVVAGVAYASWEESELRSVTEEFKKHDSTWDYWKTIAMLTSASHSSHYLGGVGGVGVSIQGKTILLDGKDITGHLGNKTTYGKNSPIIDRIDNSELAIGDKPQVISDKRTTQTNIFVKILTNIYYSVAVTFVLCLNIVLKLRVKILQIYRVDR